MKAFLMCLAMGIFMPEDQDPLSSYRWKNRIILVVEDARAKAEEQHDLFSDQRAELDDRDLLIISISDKRVLLNGRESALSSQDVSDRYDLASDEFAILLIGKDGGVKYRSSEITKPLQIYGLIDQMPMRRAEMRSGGN